MAPVLSQPVICLAEEALNALVGEEATSSLASLFTKCKDYIKDGRRIENLSWRLWHRDYRKTLKGSTTTSYILHPSVYPFAENQENSRISRSPSNPPTQLEISPEQQDTSSLPTPASQERIQSPRFWSGQVASTESTDPRSASPERPIGQTMRRILSDHIEFPSRQEHTSSPHRYQVAMKLEEAVPSTTGHRESATPSKGTRTEPSTPHLLVPDSASKKGPQVVIVNPTPHPTPPATPESREPPSNLSMAQSENPTSPAFAIGSGTAARQPQPANQRLSSNYVGSAVTNSSTTTSSDDVPTGGRKFHFHKSNSPNSTSPEMRRPPPLGTQRPILVGSPDNPMPSSVESTTMEAPVKAGSSVSSGRSRTGRPSQLNHSRAISKSKLPAISSTRNLAARKAQEARKFRMSSASDERSSSRERRRDDGPSRAGLPRQPTAGPSQPKVAQRAQPARTGNLARIATQPALLDFQQHAIRDPVGSEHLRRPLLPSAKRKVEVEQDDESGWTDSDESDDEEEELERQPAPRGDLARAATEAARQLSLFNKLAPKHYLNNANRTSSGGLSNLFRPDPNLFPANHPYRTTLSHHDLVSKLNIPGQGPTLYSATLSGLGRRATMPPPPPVQLSSSKGSAVMPDITRVTAVTSSATSGTTKPYRPRGRPDDVEVSDSGEDDPSDTVQMAQSLAQRRLEALAAHQKHRRANSQEQSLARPAPSRVRSNLDQIRDGVAQQRETQQSRSSDVVTMQQQPIPLTVGYPYNLPAPNLPSSPATTRARMWERELSQSVTYSLLREKELVKKKDERKTARPLPPRTKSWVADDFHTSGW